jgi:hypothetical protein
MVALVRGAALEEMLLDRWDPLGVPDDPERRDAYARWAVRIGVRPRHGVSAEEISELLAAASRRLGVRVNTRQLAATAMEIRRWYRQEQADHGYWAGVHAERER